MYKALAATYGSLTEGTYALLRRQLLSGRIGPGERLKVGDLVEQFGVGQGAIREALARLTADGLIESEPQRGFRAKSISAEELRDLTTVRINVEGECLRRSLRAGDLGWEKRLVSAHHQLVRTSRLLDDGLFNDEWDVAHFEFHEVLVAGCSCVWLLQLRRMLHAQSERASHIISADPDPDRDITAEHTELLTAALTRNEEKAVGLIQAHLEATTARLLRSSLIAP